MTPLLLLLVAQWDPQRTEHLDQLSRLLKQHTAYLEVKVKAEAHQPLAEKERNGFGVVLGTDLVATNYFVAENAEEVVVIGPKQVRIPGRVVLADAERRVALIRSERDLVETGLVPAKQLAPRDRKTEADVFALVATLEFAGVVSGELTDDGSAPELEGHPKTTLELSYSMPVFDAELRFVGFARGVAWDQDKKLLVPPEMIKAARTATSAAAKKKLARERRRDSRPWWGK